MDLISWAAALFGQMLVGDLRSKVVKAVARLKVFCPGTRFCLIQRALTRARSVALAT
jgi:hypothetical protein